MTFLPSPMLEKGQNGQFCRPGHWLFAVFEGSMYFLMGVRPMDLLEISCPLKHLQKVHGYCGFYKSPLCLSSLAGPPPGGKLSHFWHWETKDLGSKVKPSVWSRKCSRMKWLPNFLRWKILVHFPRAFSLCFSNAVVVPFSDSLFWMSLGHALQTASLLDRALSPES